ncbi:MAG: hypothetical protein HOJ51_01320 [Tateyamaria sp.]|nr:hypothetical protein [Tateyamaria sp.]
MENTNKFKGFLLSLACLFCFFGFTISETKAEPSFNTNNLLNKFVARLVTVAVAAARSQVEIQYQAIVPNVSLGQISIDGLVFTPGPDFGVNGCTISLGRVLVQYGDPNTLDADNISTSIYDLNVSPLCLPFEQRGMLAIAGVEEIIVPHATIDIDYVFPSASLEIFISGALKDFSEFDLYLNAPYVSFIDVNNDEQPLVFRLSKAELTVRDDGAWQALSRQIPSDFNDPISAGMNISDLLKENVFGGDTSDEVGEFLASVERTWNSFLKNPQQITLETGILPSGGININFVEYDLDPFKAFTDLRPTVSTKSLLSTSLVEQSALRQILENKPEGLSNGEKIEIAIALLKGDGVPSNGQLGVRILEELIDKNMPDAISALVNYYFDQAPQKAYFYAMSLGKTNELSSTSLLDQLEVKIPFDEVLELQSRNPIKRLNSGSSISSAYFVEKAKSYYRGLGVERSYLNSYYWASLASASGARQGEMILSNLHNLARNLDKRKSKIWLDDIAEIESMTLEDWLKFNVAKKISEG